MRCRILHGDVASKGLGNPIHLDPCSTGTNKNAFGDVAIMGRDAVDKNIVQDLPGRAGGDEDLAGVGPLGRGVSGVVDVQVSQVDVIDARVGSVARDVDAVPVATPDL